MVIFFGPSHRFRPDLLDTDRSLAKNLTEEGTDHSRVILTEGMCVEDVDF